jgi:uncharacterized cupin superfamily protein
LGKVAQRSFETDMHDGRWIGSMSALKHHHQIQDEFIYILQGSATLIFCNDEFVMQAVNCFGFDKGKSIGHQLVNKSSETVTYLEIGDHSPNDKAEYPDDDLIAESNDTGSWLFLHKDRIPYYLERRIIYPPFSV